MIKKIFILILMFFTLFSCVSKQKYKELEENFGSKTKQLIYKKQLLEEIKTELKTTTDSYKKCQSELELSKAGYDKLEQQNKILEQKIQDIEFNLKKQKSIIKVQSNVIDELDQTKKKIELSLKEQIANQEIIIEKIKDQLKVTFVDKILFNTGSVKINIKGQKTLLTLAQSLQDDKSKNIIVEGHTDNVPIGYLLKDKFPSNWELSTARAAAVVSFLEKKGQILPTRLSARGYSYYRPVNSNETEKGRQQNRRIEIILAPSSESN